MSSCLTIVPVSYTHLDVYKRQLHHDNASSHTAHQTIDYLKEENIELMSHCPYSPDLSPNDFVLFANVKQKMRGQRLSSPQEAVESLQNLSLIHI